MATVSWMLSPADIAMVEKLFALPRCQSHHAVCERNGETRDEYVASYLLTSVFGLTIGSSGEKDTGI